ncbi:hypothetical protein CPB83DRAFT_857998 [Crepidotus variabilis]|uniref:Uncharacterized protein n=1 Tax=Crepidotus variabilis TaxID=179855 RepID=A0A9P6EBI6_9AGAR|nr:hypothetical protein CPB83DRAFT_857998 [Crepidotus variabilis]
MLSITLSCFSQALNSAQRALSNCRHRNHSRVSRRGTWRNRFQNLFNSSNTFESLSNEVMYVDYAPLTLSLSSDDLLDAIEQLLRPSLDSISHSILPPTPPLQTLARSVSELGVPRRPSHLPMHGEPNYLEVPFRSLSTSSLGASTPSTPSERPRCRDASSRDSFICPDSEFDPCSPLQDVECDHTTELAPAAQVVSCQTRRNQSKFLFSLDALPQELLDYILCLAFGCVDGFELRGLDILLTRRARARAVSKEWKQSIDKLIRFQFLAIPRDFLPCDQNQTSNVTEEAWVAEVLERGGTFEAVSFRFSNRFMDSSLTNHPRHSQFLKAAAESTRRLWLYIDLRSTTPLPETEPGERTTVGSSTLRHFTWISPNTGIHSHLPQDCCFPWRNLKEDLSWTHLTHIELICPLSIDDVRFAFSQSPHLISLRATLWFSGQVATSQPRIVCPYLRELAICSTVACENLFVGVDMGGLANLSLSFPKDEPSLLFSTGHGPGGTFDPAVNIPWEQLQDLNIDYHRPERFPLSAVLSKARSVRRLALNGCPDQFICDRLPSAIEALEAVTLGPDFVGDLSALAWLFHLTEIPILSTSMVPLKPLSLPHLSELRRL